MKSHSILVLGALTFSAALFAGEGAHPVADAANDEVKTMDTNKDGTVSPAEHAAGAKKMFGMMDANHDGKVNASEMDAAHSSKPNSSKPNSHEMSSAEKIKVVDANHDGVLTAQEHSDASKAMFEKMDEDKDGRLTLAEIQTGHEQMMGATHR